MRKLALLAAATSLIALSPPAASQVTPIVHDGIMFLSNTANTVQALDARTGDLIWENRIGPAPTRFGIGRSD